MEVEYSTSIPTMFMSDVRKQLAQALRARGCLAQIRSSVEDASLYEFTIDANCHDSIGIFDPIIGYHCIEFVDATELINEIIQTKLSLDLSIRTDQIGSLLEAWSA